MSTKKTSHSTTGYLYHTTVYYHIRCTPPRRAKRAARIFYRAPPKTQFPNTVHPIFTCTQIACKGHWQAGGAPAGRHSESGCQWQQQPVRRPGAVLVPGRPGASESKCHCWWHWHWLRATQAAIQVTVATDVLVTVTQAGTGIVIASPSSSWSNHLSRCST